MVRSFDRWVGKVAIVTGVSAGIGEAIVDQLVERGVIVAGLARRIDRVKDHAKRLSGKKGKLHPIQCDLTKEEDILKAFDWVRDNLGPVHILVNNAGLAQGTTLIDGDTEKWKTVFDTNVLGLCICTREAVKQMTAKNVDGHIVHINSLAGHRIPNMKNVNVYPASKFAVTALTETLRQELNTMKSKIKITSVSPGRVQTEFAQVANFNPNPDVTIATPDYQPLVAEDVADAVTYVLSTPPHVQVHELMMRSIEQPN